jgi:1,4-dihydroxy-2-naphthoyl-CoA synthase
MKHINPRLSPSAFFAKALIEKEILQKTKEAISRFFCSGGDTQIRTGDEGFADPSLTTWLCRRIG